MIDKYNQNIPKGKMQSVKELVDSLEYGGATVLYMPIKPGVFKEWAVETLKNYTEDDVDAFGFKMVPKFEKFLKEVIKFDEELVAYFNMPNLEPLYKALKYYEDNL